MRYISPQNFPQPGKHIPANYLAWGVEFLDRGPEPVVPNRNP